MTDDDFLQPMGELLRFGRIASVDLAAGRITVRAGELETAAIRWFTGGAGGTRVWSRPKVGEQVLLFCPESDLVGAIALRGVVCEAFPPIADPAREVVRFEDGATIAYDPEAHRLDAVLPGGGVVALVAPGGVTIEADVRITGDVTVDGKITATGDVKADTISLQQHRHPGVAAGAARTQAPE